MLQRLKARTHGDIFQHYICVPCVSIDYCPNHWSSQLTTQYALSVIMPALSHSLCLHRRATLPYSLHLRSSHLPCLVISASSRLVRHHVLKLRLRHVLQLFLIHRRLLLLLRLNLRRPPQTYSTPRARTHYAATSLKYNV
jgi:hypothetical protein